jgi:hypothetical protein
MDSVVEEIGGAENDKNLTQTALFRATIHNESEFWRWNMHIIDQ